LKYPRRPMLYRAESSDSEENIEPGPSATHMDLSPN
jgi:hypothetical protein